MQLVAERLIPAPSLAEIRLKLAEKENAAGVESGATTWLSNGISIQETMSVPPSWLEFLNC